MENEVGTRFFLVPIIRFPANIKTSQLSSLFNKCEDIIEETVSVTDDKLADLQKKMQRFVDNAVEEIEMLENLTKR